MDTMTNRAVIKSIETLKLAQVGDYISAAFVETLSGELADLEQAGIDISETKDGRLVLVDY